MTTEPVGATVAQAAAIVACGGLGARFKAPEAMGYMGGSAWHVGVAHGYPDAKQFLPLAGRPVLAHTLAVLEKHPRIGTVVLVLPEEMVACGEMLVSGSWPAERADAYPKVRAVVSGGDDRQESVANGLGALAAFGWVGPVLVHDGVRPCTPMEVFDRVIEGVLSRGNAVAAIPVRDTIKRAGEDGIVRETLARDGLWQIQTPQGFWMKDLVEAYREGRRRKLRVTDDAALLEALGREVYLVEGDSRNSKLTYPEDAFLLEALLREPR